MLIFSISKIPALYNRETCVRKIPSLDQFFDKYSTTTRTYYLAIYFVPRFSENNFGFVCQRPSIYRDFTRNLVLNSAGFCKASRYDFFFQNDSWQHGFALLRTIHCAAPWRSFKKITEDLVRSHTSQVLRSADLHNRFLATAINSNCSPLLQHRIRIFTTSVL